MKEVFTLKVIAPPSSDGLSVTPVNIMSLSFKDYRRTVYYLFETLRILNRFWLWGKPVETEHDVKCAMYDMLEDAIGPKPEED
jgi:hypothetical protein